MPFTFSHPSLFLPLINVKRNFFSLSGLIIGSMVPDFEYFIRMKIQSDYSHTFLGIFWFDLPLAILLAFVFHNVVRNSLYRNLPYVLRTRLIHYSLFDWNRYFAKYWYVVVVSSLVGIFSHLLWDSFTHGTGYFVQRISFLQGAFLHPPLYKILQHGSSLIGILIILLVLWKLPEYEVEKSKVSMIYWVLFLFIVMSVVCIRLVTGLSYRLYGNVIVTIISGVLLSLFLTPTVMKIFGHKVN